jgi:hypothetical protein
MAAWDGAAQVSKPRPRYVPGCGPAAANAVAAVVRRVGGLTSSASRPSAADARM